MNSRYRFNPMIRPSSCHNPPHWFARLLALVFLLLCVAVGMVGLILPIIPGLLFLALALIIAASIFPPLERLVRRSPALAPYLDRVHGFHALDWREQLRFVCWLLVKLLVDGLRCLIGLLARLFSFAASSR